MTTTLILRSLHHQLATIMQQHFFRLVCAKQIESLGMQAQAHTEQQQNQFK
ncbi:hypothetical protein [Sulfuriferula thiophila]|uniref:hypothetical protein n=1 Tax=Sulfuriferula thiophila TaxID=1781211 RepID=UPI001673C71C|nr:hypothetical protein [Sulfuriferula thiophila]